MRRGYRSDYQMPSELTIKTVPYVKKDVLEEFRKSGSPIFKVGLENVCEIDSAGISLIVQLRRRDYIEFVNVPENVKTIAEIYRFTILFDKSNQCN